MLPGPVFFRAEAIETLAAMALRLEGKVHRRPALADPYGGDLDESLPEDHPRRHRGRRGGGFICADLLEEGRRRVLPLELDRRFGFDIRLVNGVVDLRW